MLHYLCETISALLVCLILDQSEIFTPEGDEAQSRMKNNTRKFHRQHEARTAEDLKQNLPAKLQSALSICSDKGVSSWFSALPISEHGMALPYTKGPSGTLFVCDMVGDFHIYPPTVSAARIFQLSMHLAAQGVDLPLFVTMKFVTSLKIC